MTKSIFTIKCKRHRTSYITFKTERSQHDLCAKHVKKINCQIGNTHRIIMIFMA